MRTRRRFRWRWLGVALLCLLPFTPASEVPRLRLCVLAAETPPIERRLAAPAQAAEAPRPSAHPGALDRLAVLRTDRFVLRLERELVDYGRRLAAEAERGFESVQATLGGAPEIPVELRVVSNPREMAAVAPPHSPPPPWASGVAYAEHNLIVLSLTSPRDGRFIPLFAVLRHELAHLAIERITGGRPIPRWFDEGIALWAAGDNYAGRHEVLLRAALRDRLLPLEAIEYGYPQDPRQVSLAYAQSLDFVSYLVDNHGRAALRQVLRQIGEGKPFHEAFIEAFGTPVAQLDEEWRRQIQVWYRWVPALASGTTIWGVMSFLLAWAYFHQRRRRQALYAEWDRAELAEEAAAPASGVWPDPDPKPWGGIRLPPNEGPDGATSGSRKGTVIYHDGRFHTLH